MKKNKKRVEKFNDKDENEIIPGDYAPTIYKER